MNNVSQTQESILPQALIAHLADSPITKAVQQVGLAMADPIRAASQLTDEALVVAESKPAQASHLLAIANALNSGDDNSPLTAQIAYAQARVHLASGEIESAERSVRYAQSIWQKLGDVYLLTRSFLGLTQILTLQGKYAEAESTIGLAIDDLKILVTNDVALLPQLLAAQRNLANLLTYQEKHQRALAEFTVARKTLETFLTQQTGLEEGMTEILEAEEAHLELCVAVVLMSLDQPIEAEQSLMKSLSYFDKICDEVNRGRVHSNLGSLFLKTGRYARALDHFNLAVTDLLGDVDIWIEPSLDALYQADVTPLDLAMVYLTINLLPEATRLLELCEPIFRKAMRPYEEGQTLYTLGLVRLRRHDPVGAVSALEQAQVRFAELENDYWLNRTTIAQAAIAFQNGNWSTAKSLLNSLEPYPLIHELGINQSHDGPVAWDTNTLFEYHLLHLRLHLQANEVDMAQQKAQQIASFLQKAEIHSRPPDTESKNNEKAQVDSSAQTAAFDIEHFDIQRHARHQSAGQTILFAHLQQRLEHVWGQIESTLGNREAAHQHFRHSIHLIESQRSTLPLEEIRMAFLDDKTHAYSDLVISILDEADRRNADSADSTETSDSDLLVEAFATVEQARSRSLLERLRSALPDSSIEDVDVERAAQRNMARQQLHWLYNQLLRSEYSTRADHELRSEIRQYEQAIQTLEWKSSSLVSQAQPATLVALQESLVHEQLALIYYTTQDEVLAFVVTTFSIQCVRHLCTMSQLHKAHTELRFQMGRVELGRDYLQRHSRRIQAGIQSALHQLYHYLIEPLHPYLTATRLLFIPHGLLHRIPFHALWDGEEYLIARFECSYVPSASMAVHCHQQADKQNVKREQLTPQQDSKKPFSSLAGVAITDSTIPHALTEVLGAAKHFEPSWLYLDQDASREGLEEAAAQADILHIATHGLFREDNPFFSALKLADGWLDVREIYRLTLRSKLIVLSACKSGSGRVQSGDEVIGLARGFMGAGATSLLVSLWNVHDSSAEILMDQFYQHLVAPDSTFRPASALRAAQLHCIHADQHPYYWASFVALGVE